MNNRRIVITGIGVVSPLGSDLNTFWSRIQSGYSGITRIRKFDPTGYACQIAGEVFEFDLDRFVSKKDQRRMDDYSHYAIAAAELAMADSHIDLNSEAPERMGAIVASGIGGLRTLQIAYANLLEKGPKSTSPFMIPRMISNMAGGLIAIRFNLQGPNYAVVSACASSAHAIGDALRIIRNNEADVILAGGAEAAVCEIGVDGFGSMRALSTRNDMPEKASRPFDKHRDGFVMADGAGILVLEELERAKKRGAKIYCEVAGQGATCDAYHMTVPAEGGTGAARAMNLAMADAGLLSKDIDYINAHGTSTQLNDKIETEAIKIALGELDARKVMISSTKSMTGHMIGAAGSIEVAICALALRDAVVPPTINYETPDPVCDLDYVPNTARDVNIRACLSNSFGFGGHNVCIALKRLKD
jgi:3-oxoacyl-[acyl-carrier-protein] synthase II